MAYIDDVRAFRKEQDEREKRGDRTPVSTLPNPAPAVPQQPQDEAIRLKGTDLRIDASPAPTPAPSPVVVSQPAPATRRENPPAQLGSPGTTGMPASQPATPTTEENLSPVESLSEELQTAHNDLQSTQQSLAERETELAAKYGDRAKPIADTLARYNESLTELKSELSDQDVQPLASFSKASKVMLGIAAMYEGFSNRVLQSDKALTVLDKAVEVDRQTQEAKFKKTLQLYNLTKDERDRLTTEHKDLLDKQEAAFRKNAELVLASKATQVQSIQQRYEIAKFGTELRENNRQKVLDRQTAEKNARTSAGATVAAAKIRALGVQAAAAHRAQQLPSHLSERLHGVNQMMENLRGVEKTLKDPSSQNVLWSRVTQIWDENSAAQRQALIGLAAARAIVQNGGSRPSDFDAKRAAQSLVNKYVGQSFAEIYDDVMREVGRSVSATAKTFAAQGYGNHAEQLRTSFNSFVSPEDTANRKKVN